MHCKSYSHFFSKKFQHICVSLDVNFNESLTNEVVSFEQLGPDVAIAVADGTYIYIEKSGNYSFQRRSYSVHTGQPLLKPMMLVATDDYILTVKGPYLADGKNTDATITEHMLKTNADILLTGLKKMMYSL